MSHRPRLWHYKQKGLFKRFRHAYQFSELPPMITVTLPFAPGSFSVVFTSNELEYIPHVVDIQWEIARVLEPDGTAIHVLPSAARRFYTKTTDLIRKPQLIRRLPSWIVTANGVTPSANISCLVDLSSGVASLASADLSKQSFRTDFSASAKSFARANRPCNHEPTLSRFFGSSYLIYLFQRNSGQHAKCG